MKKHIIICILAIVLLTMGVYAIDFYQPIETGDYRVLEATGNEALYKVVFERQNKNKTKICLEANFSTYNGYDVPATLKLRKNTILDVGTDLNRELENWDDQGEDENFDDGDKYKFCYTADINTDKWLKFGDNSVIVIPKTVTVSQTIRSSTRSDGNFTHLEISETSPYDSLVLYMPFDVQDETGITYDYSQYDNDGTVTGATWNADGKYGGDYGFDGLDDDISISYTDVYNFSNKNFSVSLWLKRKDSDNSDVVIGQYHWTDDRVWVIDQISDNYRFWVYHNGSANNFTESRIAQSTINEWVYFVGVWNQTHTSTYKNGIRVDSDANVDGSIIHSNTKDIVLGDTDSSSAFWNGTIDEVMIFNTSLTPTQIQAIYNNQSARFKTTGTQKLPNQNITEVFNQVNITDNTQTLKDSSFQKRINYWQESYGYDDTEDGLVAVWHLDGNANDSVGNNDGTVTGATVEDSRFGRGYSFDGVNDYINFTEDTSLAMGNVSQTYALWYRHIGGESRYILADRDNTKGGFSIFIGSSWISPMIGTALQEGLYQSLDDEWHHLIMVYNTSSVRAYIDGIFQKEDLSITGTFDSTVERYIGNRKDGANYFNGSIDEVRIYNRSLNATEIMDLYVNSRLNYQSTDWQTTNNFRIDNLWADVIQPEYKYLGSFYSPILQGVNLTTGINCSYPVENLIITPSSNVCPDSYYNSTSIYNISYYNFLNLSVNKTENYDIILNNDARIKTSNYVGRRDIRIINTSVTIRNPTGFNTYCNSTSVTCITDFTTITDKMPTNGRSFLFSRTQSDDPYLTSLATTITEYDITYVEGTSLSIDCTGSGSHTVTNLNDILDNYNYILHYKDSDYIGYIETSSYIINGCSEHLLIGVDVLPLVSSSPISQRILRGVLGLFIVITILLAIIYPIINMAKINWTTEQWLNYLIIGFISIILLIVLLVQVFNSTV